MQIFLTINWYPIDKYFDFSFLGSNPYSPTAILKACLKLGGELSACVAHAKFYGNFISNPINNMHKPQGTSHHESLFSSGPTEDSYANEILDEHPYADIQHETSSSEYKPPWWFHCHSHRQCLFLSLCEDFIYLRWFIILFLWKKSSLRSPCQYEYCWNWWLKFWSVKIV